MRGVWPPRPWEEWQLTNADIDPVEQAVRWLENGDGLSPSVDTITGLARLRHEGDATGLVIQGRCSVSPMQHSFHDLLPRVPDTWDYHWHPGLGSINVPYGATQAAAGQFWGGAGWNSSEWNGWERLSSKGGVAGSLGLYGIAPYSNYGSLYSHYGLVATPPDGIYICRIGLASMPGWTKYMAWSALRITPAVAQPSAVSLSVYGPDYGNAYANTIADSSANGCTGLTPGQKGHIWVIANMTSGAYGPLNSHSAALWLGETEDPNDTLGLRYGFAPIILNAQYYRQSTFGDPNYKTGQEFAVGSYSVTRLPDNWVDIEPNVAYTGYNLRYWMFRVQANGGMTTKVAPTTTAPPPDPVATPVGDAVGPAAYGWTHPPVQGAASYHTDIVRMDTLEVVADKDTYATCGAVDERDGLPAVTPEAPITFASIHYSESLDGLQSEVGTMTAPVTLPPVPPKVELVGGPTLLEGGQAFSVTVNLLGGATGTYNGEALADGSTVVMAHAADVPPPPPRPRIALSFSLSQLQPGDQMALLYDITGEADVLLGEQALTGQGGLTVAEGIDGPPAVVHAQVLPKLLAADEDANITWHVEGNGQFVLDDIVRAATGTAVAATAAPIPPPVPVPVRVTMSPTTLKPGEWGVLSWHAPGAAMVVQGEARESTAELPVVQGVPGVYVPPPTPRAAQVYRKPSHVVMPERSP